MRLTAKEKDMIRRRAEKANMSLTDYLVAAALQTPIHVAEDVKPIILELKRIGNNLNQITTKVNAGLVRCPDLHDVSDDLKHIYEEVYRIARSG